MAFVFTAETCHTARDVGVVRRLRERQIATGSAYTDMYALLRSVSGRRFCNDDGRLLPMCEVRRGVEHS